MFNVYKLDSFIGFDKNYDESNIVLIGAPFDGTVSFRPGTRFATNIIRTESFGLETYSPYLDKDLEDLSLCDIGDIEFPFGNKELTLDNIESSISEIVLDNKKPLMVGGEHLVTLPAVKGVLKKYPDICIIHLDAHCDLREDYMGEKLSHATVIKRVWDLVGDNRIFQFGIRSGTKDEFFHSKGHTYMEKFSVDTFSETLKKISGRPIYFTIDLDVLDPSAFPGTGTPEPGGITTKELLECIHSLEGYNIVGADVVELSPHYDSSGVSTAVACKVIRELAMIM